MSKAIALSDAVLRAKHVVELLRQKVAGAGGQSAWAKKTGIHRSLVNKILRGKSRLPNRSSSAPARKSSICQRNVDDGKMRRAPPLGGGRRLLQFFPFDFAEPICQSLPCAHQTRPRVDADHLRARSLVRMHQASVILAADVGRQVIQNRFHDHFPLGKNPARNAGRGAKADHS
jgi:hypothetical protein